jgi:hemerythrin superfamily protein
LSTGLRRQLIESQKINPLNSEIIKFTLIHHAVVKMQRVQERFNLINRVLPASNMTGVLALNLVISSSSRNLLQLNNISALTSMYQLSYQKSYLVKKTNTSTQRIENLVQRIETLNLNLISMEQKIEERLTAMTGLVFYMDSVEMDHLNIDTTGYGTGYSIL